MSWHDESTEEETAPRRDAYSDPDEATNLVGHVPDDVRRSAALALGDEADAEDMTAPTRVRDDELRAALAGAQPRPRPGASSPQRPRQAAAAEEATEVNVVNTSELDAIIRGQSGAQPAPQARPAPQAPRHAGPAPRQAAPQARPAPGRARPMQEHNPFSEDEPTQANVIRDADLRQAAQPTGRPPAGAANPFGPPQPYDAHAQPAAPTARAPQPQRPAGHEPQRPQRAGAQPSGVPLAERTDPTRPKPRKRPDDDPVGLAAEVSWSSHVDEAPVARPMAGPPTGFGPAIKGPARHPGAPVQRGDLSNDSLIRQQLAESSRDLTRDELDAVTNHMLMIGGVASFVFSFFLYAMDMSVLLIIITFAVLVGGMGAVARKFPAPCESFLNVLSINVRKE
jgi:hypothetical protein